MESIVLWDMASDLVVERLDIDLSDFSQDEPKNLGHNRIPGISQTTSKTILGQTNSFFIIGTFHRGPF